MNRPSIRYGYGRHSTNKQELTRGVQKAGGRATSGASPLLSIAAVLTAADPPIRQLRGASGEAT